MDDTVSTRRLFCVTGSGAAGLVASGARRGAAQYIGTTARVFLNTIENDPDPNVRYVAYSKLASPPVLRQRRAEGRGREDARREAPGLSRADRDPRRDLPDPRRARRPERPRRADQRGQRHRRRWSAFRPAVRWARWASPRTHGPGTHHDGGHSGGLPDRGHRGPGRAEVEGSPGSCRCSSPGWSTRTRPSASPRSSAAEHHRTSIGASTPPPGATPSCPSHRPHPADAAAGDHRRERRRPPQRRPERRRARPRRPAAELGLAVLPTCRGRSGCASCDNDREANRAGSRPCRRRGRGACGPRCEDGGRGVMDTHTLELLEFDKIRALVAAQAACSLGKEAARRMEPSRDPGEIRDRQALTTEMAEALASGLTPPFGGLHDIRPHVRRAQIGGHARRRGAGRGRRDAPRRSATSTAGSAGSATSSPGSAG